MNPMRLWWLILVLGIAAVSRVADAKQERTEHTVAPGQTLARIAKRYHVSVDSLCAANGFSRDTTIQPGQALVIPSPGEEPRVHVVSKRDTLGKLADHYDVPLEQLIKVNGLHRTSTLLEGQKLLIPPSSASGHLNRTTAGSGHYAPDQQPPRSKPSRVDREPPPGSGPETMTVAPSSVAYFYRPIGRGRLGPRPVLIYLHGRGGQPEADCQRWEPIARRWGWLVCPGGPEDRGSGRGWANNWLAGHHIVMAALQGLRSRFGPRVQLQGNTIIGFSEGAYVAMNIGVREPRTFNRWLILAAKSTYWGGPGLEALGEARRQLKRVFLITGGEDEVIAGTEDALRRLRDAGVQTRVATPEDMGHEVPLERKAQLYRAALLWLEQGKLPVDRENRRPARTALR